MVCNARITCCQCIASIKPEFWCLMLSFHYLCFFSDSLSRISFITSVLHQAGLALVYDLTDSTKPSLLSTFSGDRRFSRFGGDVFLSDLDNDGLGKAWWSWIKGEMFYFGQQEDWSPTYSHECWAQSASSIDLSQYSIVPIPGNSVRNWNILTVIVIRNCGI